MRLILLILMSVAFLASNGQSVGSKAESGKQPGISFVFDQKAFGDRFSVLSFSEDDYDYYVVDMTRLGDKFEKVYFMNLTYEDPRIINLDPDIEKEHIWFKSYQKYNETEITCLFNDLREKAAKASQEMTAAEKETWMAKFDKFPKSKGHE